MATGTAASAPGARQASRATSCASAKAASASRRAKSGASGRSSSRSIPASESVTVAAPVPPAGTEPRRELAQRRNERDERGMQHGALPEVDDLMRHARVEADAGGAAARLLQREARPPPRAGRHAAERRELLRHKRVLAERGLDLLLLRRDIGALRQMLERAAAAAAEMPADRRRALARREHRDQLGGTPLAAAFAEARGDAVAGRGKGNVDRPAVMDGNAVAPRADALDDERHRRFTHGGDRRAAMRNSTFPSGPRIGLSVTPSTCQPGCAPSQAAIRAQTSRWSTGLRTTPPLPTLLLPTSNCGLMSATRRALGAASASAAGSTVSSPMKLASETMRSGGSGTSARVR